MQEVNQGFLEKLCSACQINLRLRMTCLYGYRHISFFIQQYIIFNLVNLDNRSIANRAYKTRFLIIAAWYKSKSIHVREIIMFSLIY